MALAKAKQVSPERQLRVTVLDGRAFSAVVVKGGPRIFCVIADPAGSAIGWGADRQLAIGEAHIAFRQAFNRDPDADTMERTMFDRPKLRDYAPMGEHVRVVVQAEVAAHGTDERSRVASMLDALDQCAAVCADENWFELRDAVRMVVDMHAMGLAPIPFRVSEKAAALGLADGRSKLVEE